MKYIKFQIYKTPYNFTKRSALAWLFAKLQLVHIFSVILLDGTFVNLQFFNQDEDHPIPSLSKKIVKSSYSPGEPVFTRKYEKSGVLIVLKNAVRPLTGSTSLSSDLPPRLALENELTRGSWRISSYRSNRHRENGVEGFSNGDHFVRVIVISKLIGWYFVFSNRRTWHSKRWHEIALRWVVLLIQK